jgi:hypothetical protein
MSDSEFEPNEAEFPERKPLTDEQIELLKYMWDSERDTTMNGRPRCQTFQKGPDGFGGMVWVRCMEEAKLRILISEREQSWALVCYDCCSHSDLVEELNRRDNEARIAGGSPNRLTP